MSFTVLVDDPRMRASYSRPTAQNAFVQATALLKAGAESVSIQDPDGLFYKASMFDGFLEKWAKTPR
jgi:hypothetical protein